MLSRLRPTPRRLAMTSSEKKEEPQKSNQSPNSGIFAPQPRRVTSPELMLCAQRSLPSGSREEHVANDHPAVLLNSFSEHLDQNSGGYYSTPCGQGEIPIIIHPSPMIESNPNADLNCHTSPPVRANNPLILDSRFNPTIHPSSKQHPWTTAKVRDPNTLSSIKRLSTSC